MIDYVWNLDNTLYVRVETDTTVQPTTVNTVTFDYDNRHRLIEEERVLDGDPDVTIYDITYTYDQLGNRETKTDSVSGLTVEYTYDVELDPEDSSQWPGYPNNYVFPTCNNRLLYYTVENSSEQKLRTVNYLYYQGGHVSNIIVKDEYIQGVTPGSQSDYDWLYSLTFYYDTRSAPRLVLWQRWQLDENDEPDEQTVERLLARDFRYEWLFGTTRARYLTVDFDPENYEDPWNWPPIEPIYLTDYAGVSPYQDATVDQDGQGEWESPVTTRNYLFPGVERESGGAETYYHGDLLDSTMMTTDEDGDPLESTAYTAFGELVDGYSELDTRYQYAGGYGYESAVAELSGPNTDLAPLTFQHVGWRWYQPDIGRFIQRDPVGLGGGLNVYIYCGANPPGSVDPSGLDVFLPPQGGPISRIERMIAEVLEKMAAGNAWKNYRVYAPQLRRLLRLRNLYYLRRYGPWAIALICIHYCVVEPTVAAADDWNRRTRDIPGLINRRRHGRMGGFGPDDSDELWGGRNITY